MATSSNSTPVPKIQQRDKKQTCERDAMDYEAPIGEAYGASLAFESWANDTFAAKQQRDAEGFLVFRLTDDELKILFFLLYATLDQTRALYRLFHGNSEDES